jgi:hypothetical protein
VSLILPLIEEGDGSSLTLLPIEEGGGPSFILPPIEEGSIRRNLPSRDAQANLRPSSLSLLPEQMREGEVKGF